MMKTNKLGKKPNKVSLSTSKSITTESDLHLGLLLCETQYIHDTFLQYLNPTHSKLLRSII